MTTRKTGTARRARSTAPTRRSHRGVWLDPGTGPLGTSVYSVIDSQNRKLATVLVPPGDELTFADALLRFLDAVDPPTGRRRAARPVYRRLADQRAVRQGLHVVPGGGAA